jgi:hypothetical protein
MTGSYPEEISGGGFFAPFSERHTLSKYSITAILCASLFSCNQQTTKKRTQWKSTPIKKK